MLQGIEINAVVFFVKNLNRAVTFYRDTLGLSTKLEQGNEGPYATAEAGKTLLVLIEREEQVGKTPIIVFGLEGGIEDVVEGLANRGVEIVVPVSEAPSGGLTADFLDPDGHVISVYQPPGAPARK